MAGQNRKAQAPLDLPAIATAAWTIVDEGGIQALTTRSLAARLGVKSPALYWHVSGMPALHSLMVEQMLTESVRPPKPGEAWRSWLFEVCMEQRRRFLSHRDSGKILANAPPTDMVREVIMPMLTAPLINAGLGREDAFAAAGALASLQVGWVIYAQNELIERYIESHIDPDAGFAFALAVFIEGLAGRVNVTRGAETSAGQANQLQNL